VSNAGLALKLENRQSKVCSVIHRDAMHHGWIGV
jgi:hypothetical protein